MVKILSGDSSLTQRKRTLCRTPGTQLPQPSCLMEQTIQTPHILGQERLIWDTIEKAYVSDSSTSANVQSQLPQMGITVSQSHIRRIRRRLGFERKTVEYCQMTRDVNKVKRMEFCSKMLTGGRHSAIAYLRTKALFRVTFS